MTNEFGTKPTKINPAIVGTIASADDYNNNIAGQSKGALLPINADGNYADGDIGSESVVANGALINNIKMRQGGFIKIYDSSGNFLNNVSFSNASTTSIGQTYLNNSVIPSFNATDPNNDIDFSPGNFIFSDGSSQGLLASAITKQLDAPWVFGNNNGGLFSGTKAANTVYYLYLIYNPTSNLVNAGFSTSLVPSDLPSGYAKFKRIGTIRTDSSSNIDPSYISVVTTNGQIATVRNAAVASTTLQIPYDDTLPQIGEGAEFLRLPYAPISAKSKLRIRALFNFSNSSGATGCPLAIFKDSGADAIISGVNASSGAAVGSQGIIDVSIDSIAIAAQIYTLRAGPSAAQTLTFNGQSGVRRFAGSLFSTLTIIEEL